MSNFTDVKDWMEHVGQVVRTDPNSIISGPEFFLRRKLMEEELRELLEAMDDNDIIEIADGIADLLYVVYGTAATYGIDADTVFAEVHRSNLTKSRDDTREDGKVMKGPGYSPPDIAAVLNLVDYEDVPGR